MEIGYVFLFFMLMSQMSRNESKRVKNPSLQESMPITYFDADTGFELPIPEIPVEEYLAASEKRKRMSPPCRAPSLEEDDEDYDERFDFFICFYQSFSERRSERRSNYLSAS